MLKICEQSDRNIIQLILGGKFDFWGIKDFKTAIHQAKAKKPQDLILDLKRVSFIDSAALGLLIKTQKSLAPQNIYLSLVTTPDSFVDIILKQATIPSLIPIFSDIPEALASCHDLFAVAPESFPGDLIRILIHSRILFRQHQPNVMMKFLPLPATAYRNRVLSFQNTYWPML